MLWLMMKIKLSKRNRLELLQMLCKTFDNYLNFSTVESSIVTKLILNFKSKNSKKIKNSKKLFRR